MEYHVKHYIMFDSLFFHITSHYNIGEYFDLSYYRLQSPCTDQHSRMQVLFFTELF